MIDLLKLSRSVVRRLSPSENVVDDLVGDVVLALVEASIEISDDFSEAQIARFLRTRARWVAIGKLKSIKVFESIDAIPERSSCETFEAVSVKIFLRTVRERYRSSLPDLPRTKSRASTVQGQKKTPIDFG